MFGFFKKSAAPLTDAWTVAQSENEGRPMFLRINTGLQPFAGKPPYDHRFGLCVPLRRPDAHGLPDEAETEALHQLEDALMASFHAAGRSCLAVVITTSGFREFVFYTAVAREIPAAVEQFRRRVTSHEIQFYVEPDPQWGVYKSFQLS